MLLTVLNSSFATSSVISFTDILASSALLNDELSKTPHNFTLFIVELIFLFHYFISFYFYFIPLVDAAVRTSDFYSPQKSPSSSVWAVIHPCKLLPPPRLKKHWNMFFFRERTHMHLVILQMFPLVLQQAHPWKCFHQPKIWKYNLQICNTQNIPMGGGHWSVERRWHRWHNLCVIWQEAGAFTSVGDV